MKLSNGERLIVAMLCDISRKLDAGREIDPDFVMKSLGDHEWGLGWKYSGLIDSETPPLVRETADILTMWRALEETYAELSPDDQQRVQDAVGQTGPVKFPGFDANNDDHYGIARYMIEDLERFECFKTHYLNSHSRGSLPGYKQMLRRFDIATFYSEPSADKIIYVMEGRRA